MGNSGSCSWHVFEFQQYVHTGLDDEIFAHVVEVYKHREVLPN